MTINIKAKEEINSQDSDSERLNSMSDVKEDAVKCIEQECSTPVRSDFTSTMKKIVWVCLGNGILWVWFSYILAALDKVQIAESLSQVAVTEIIGVVLVYSLKSLAENLSKNNKWPDKPNNKNHAGLG